MSYILDALKRSEQERRQAEAPVATAAVAPPPVSNRPWLARLALLTVLANLAALAWLFWPSQPPLEEVPAARVMAPPPDENASLAQLSGSGRPAQQPPARPATTPDSAPAAAAVPAPQAREPDVPPAASPRAEAPPASPATARSPRVVIADAPLTADTDPAAPTAAPESPAQPAEVPLLESLPAALRGQLPPLNVNIHVFAEQPQSRFVVIDMRRFREGDSLPGGYRLRSIAPQGLVLEHQGQVFLMTVR